MRRPVIISGAVFSLDTNQPLNGVVVQLLGARTSSSAAATSAGKTHDIPTGSTNGLLNNSVRHILREPSGVMPELRAYALTLEQQAQDFDLDRLPQTLQRFGDIYQKLANAQESLP